MTPGVRCSRYLRILLFMRRRPIWVSSIPIRRRWRKSRRLKRKVTRRFPSPHSLKGERWNRALLTKMLQLIKKKKSIRTMIWQLLEGYHRKSLERWRGWALIMEKIQIRTIRLYLGARWSLKRVWVAIRLTHREVVSAQRAVLFIMMKSQL